MDRKDEYRSSEGMKREQETTADQMKLAGRVVQSYVGINRVTSRLAQENAASLGVTLPQMAILNTLLASPNLSLKQLTEKLMSSKSTMSVNIDGLVSGGLVLREIPEENRREVKLTLTEAGEALARQSIRSASSYRAMAKVLEKIDPADIAELLRLNQEILLHLEEEL